LARHVNGSSPREVAIKFYRNSDPDTIARIKREFEALRDVRHPCIPRVYGNGIGWYRDGGPDPVPYIVMEYAGAKTLADRIARERCIPVDQALKIAAQVADALDACHARGVVHRDVKPLNIRISHSDRGSDRAMLVDFGIVRKHDLRITIHGNILGTAYYMSPEQVKDEMLDGKSDQYSLAISLWEMLTGRVTFEGKTAWEVMYKHVHDPPGPLKIPTLSYDDPRYAKIDSALRKALSKDREARFSSCTEFIRAASGAVPPSQKSTVEVCAASGLLPGPYCRERRSVPADEAPRLTCTVCGPKPPVTVEVEVCRASNLLPGLHCKREKRRFPEDKVPTKVCDRCERPTPPVVRIKLCEKTGMKAGWGCRTKVVQEFPRDKVPPPCRECKFPWWLPALAAVGPVMVLLIAIAAILSGSGVPVEFDVKPSDAKIEWRKLDDSRWRVAKNNREVRVPEGQYKVKISARGYETKVFTENVTGPKDHAHAQGVHMISATLKPDLASRLLGQSQKAVESGDIAGGVARLNQAVNWIRAHGIYDPQALATTRRCLLNEARYQLKQGLYLQAAQLYEVLWNSQDVVPDAQSKRQCVYAFRAADCYYERAKEVLRHNADVSGPGAKALRQADSWAQQAKNTGADPNAVEKLRKKIRHQGEFYFDSRILDRWGFIRGQ